VGSGATPSDQVHQWVIVGCNAGHMKATHDNAGEARVGAGQLAWLARWKPRKGERMCFLYEFWSFDFEFRKGFENIYPFNQNMLRDKTYALT
jgi:hypothetical protein